MLANGGLHRFKMPPCHEDEYYFVRTKFVGEQSQIGNIALATVEWNQRTIQVRC
jgi:hypothetical protein